MYRPIFVTNSSSSCMIVWEKYPENYPTNLERYEGTLCPTCYQIVAEENKLDSFLEGELHEKEVRRLIHRKLLDGCAIFYGIRYLGSYKEDRIEYGTEGSGHFSFQGNSDYNE
jgi:hypothetical protein